MYKLNIEYADGYQGWTLVDTCVFKRKAHETEQDVQELREALINFGNLVEIILDRYRPYLRGNRLVKLWIKVGSNYGIDQLLFSLDVRAIVRDSSFPNLWYPVRIENLDVTEPGNLYYKVEDVQSFDEDRYSYIPPGNLCLRFGQCINCNQFKPLDGLDNHLRRCPGYLRFMQNLNMNNTSDF